MSKNKKKLLLSKDRVRELGKDSLGGVAGGSNNTCAISCPTAGTWTFSINGSILTGKCLTPACQSLSCPYSY